MSKFTIALPILALLALSAVVLLNSNNDLSASSTLTIDDWQRCFQVIPANYCDSITDASALQLCYKAASANSDLVWDGASKELPACQSFYAYFKKSQSGDELNYNNYYNSCFSDASAVAAAKISPYFYESIFGPKYLKCAGLSE